MNILIATIGKWKKSPEKELFEHYVKRLPPSWKIELKEIAVKERPNAITKQKAEETKKLLAACDSFGAHNIIALDECGKTLASTKLASMLANYSDMGNSKLAFIIGGHAGLDDIAKEKADKIISFGAVTWPHLLVRALLAEQLYRCYSINIGHPYHRI